MPLISCKNLFLGYGARDAVEDATFEIERGDFVFIVGENGSGKTTLLRGLLGLLPPRAGSVSLEMPKSGVGYLPQSLSVRRDFPATVLEIALSGACREKKLFHTKKDRESARRFLARLGVSNLEQRSFNELSGGQRQRVLLARALLSGSSLLILDEPAASLDQNAAKELYAVLKSLNEEDGVTILLVSHDLSSALAADKKILHIGGSIRYFGPAREYRGSASYREFFGGETNERPV